MDIKRSGILANYLPEKQLASELGCCERTLARWREQRIGPPFVKRGRAFEYNVEEARRWLAAGGTAAVKLGRRKV